MNLIQNHPLGLIVRKVRKAPFTGVQYKTTLTTTTDETLTTWTGVDIGQAHPHRMIILATFMGVNVTPATTVNGFTTIDKIRNNEFGITFHIVPTGSTATITASGVSSARKAIGVYVAYPMWTTLVDSGSTSAATTTDANLADLKVVRGGALIYSGGQLSTLGTFTTTWNGTDAVIEDIDAQLEATSSYTSGHINITNSSDISDLNMAESNSGAKRLAAISIYPALYY